MSTMTTYRRSVWPRASSFRLVAFVGAAAITAAGLAVHYLRQDTVGAYTGAVLYAALVYAIVVVVVPRIRPRVAALTAFTFCAVVELSQLTPYPAQLSAGSEPARLVLGTTFDAPDIGWYAVGVALLLALHTVAYRKARSGVSVDAY
jgi:hypothetical protein